MKLTGIIPALLTPFDKDGEVNHKMVRELVEFHIAQGATGEYVGGSTGEGFLLTEAERCQLAETVIDQVRGRIPVVIQVGSVSTAEAARLAAHAKKAGADGVSSVPPFYYSVGLAGVKGHYAEIGKAGGLPLWIYNIPGTTGVNVTPAMAKEIVEEVPTIVGMKFTSYNFFEMRQIIDLEFKDGRKLNVVSGPDEMMVAGQAMGADGAIGTTYNVLCRYFVEMYHTFHRGEVQKATDMQAQANRVITTFLSFPSLAAVKEIARLIGFDCGSPRRPLPPLSAADKDLLKQKLTDCGFFQIAAMRG